MWVPTLQAQLWLRRSTTRSACLSLHKGHHLRGSWALLLPSFSWSGAAAPHPPVCLGVLIVEAELQLVLLTPPLAWPSSAHLDPWVQVESSSSGSCWRTRGLTGPLSQILVTGLLVESH